MNSIKISLLGWIVLFVLFPPLAFWLVGVTGLYPRLVVRPTVGLAFSLSQTLAVWGCLWAMISTGFAFWQILLGLSAVFAAIAAINMLVLSCWENSASKD